MTLAEELRTKYALTSLKPKGASLVLLAISEALELAAEIAEQENSPAAASRIRSLKWVGRASGLGQHNEAAHSGRMTARRNDESLIQPSSRTFFGRIH